MDVLRPPFHHQQAQFPQSKYSLASQRAHAYYA